MAFTIENTSLPGCYILNPKIHEDDRGQLIKTVHEPEFKEKGLEANFKEEYFSISKKNVLRGMHFQTPPHEHVKLVYCMLGQVLDVLLDLRKDSPTFGKAIGIDLSEQKRNIIYIPSGIAHGFYTLSERAIMVYKTSTVYNNTADAGLLWSSFDFIWPNEHPILSARDQKLPGFSEFTSPF